MDQKQKEIGLEMLLQLLKEAVGQVLSLQDGESFLSWMRTVAPERFPEVFAMVPEGLRSALATELGRQIWNVTPLPHNGYRPLPLPRPRHSDPCPCQSGRRYGKCCAGAPVLPGLNRELAWALAAGEIPLDDAVELAEAGRIPRPYVGIVARRLLEEGQQARSLAVLEPLFRDPRLLDDGDADSLDALLGAYETLGRQGEMRAFIERFAEAFLHTRGEPPGGPEEPPSS
jgi:SEC-C motif-containing protein